MISKETQRSLEKAIGRALRPHGFKRLGKSKWVIEFEDCWHVFYLQKSHYSDMFMLEGAVSRKEKLQPDENPSVESAYDDERDRIRSMIHATETTPVPIVIEIEEALNFTDADEDSILVKIETIERMVSTYGPSWFEKQYPSPHD